MATLVMGETLPKMKIEHLIESESMEVLRRVTLSHT
jgi:hypothetical protein